MDILTFEVCCTIVTVYRNDLPYREILFRTPKDARQFVKKRRSNPHLPWHTTHIARYRQVRSTKILQLPDGRMNY